MSLPTTSAEPSATRILIVDDSRAIQAIIRRVIERIGFSDLKIQSAASGSEALDKVDTFHPHLVLSDWHMPGMSGLEMFQAMRQQGLSQLKVGFITTESSPELLEQARNNGAAFILNKPFRDDGLVREVTAALPLNASREQAEPAAQPIKPVAVPAEPPAAAALIEEDALRQLLTDTLGEIPFRLLRHDGLAAGELTAMNLMGIFSSPGRAVTAVVVLDAKAVCIIGGGAAGLMPGPVRAAMAEGRPSKQMEEQAMRFITRAAELLHPGDGASSRARLSKANMVPQSLQKLADILDRSVLRLDCRVSVPGYGDGRFSFLGL